jgi:hypothetical protein
MNRKGVRAKLTCRSYDTFEFFSRDMLTLFINMSTQEKNISTFISKKVLLNRVHVKNISGPIFLLLLMYSLVIHS